MVVGQKVALGRIHKHQTVTVLVSETTLAVELGDGDVRVIRLTTTRPVRSIKGQRPRTAPFPRPRAAHQLADMRHGSVVGLHSEGGVAHHSSDDTGLGTHALQPVRDRRE